jgi:hypothetical protein
MSEYPKMRFHADGRHVTVSGPQEENEASRDGFGSDPSGYYRLHHHYAPATETKAQPHPAALPEPMPAKRRGRPPKIRTLETDNG